ncbi:unnamed protein product [Phaeothamnion confervicola]
MRRFAAIAAFAFGACFFSTNVVQRRLTATDELTTLRSVGPEQIHLAFAKPSSAASYSISVRWVTWELASTWVFSQAKEGKERWFNGTSTSYSVGKYTSGRLHTAVLLDLPPSTAFRYRCGDPTAGQMSRTLRFKTPPLPAPPPSTFAAAAAAPPLVVGVVGDLGQTANSKLTLAGLAAEPSLAFVLHAGDLSYADCDPRRWDSYSRLVEPVASRLPWMAAAGNHEIEVDPDTGETYVAWEARYAMPRERPAEFGPATTRRSGGDVAPSADRVADGKSGLPPWRGLRAPAGRTAAVGEPAAEADARRRLECTPSEFLGTYNFGNSFFSFDVATLHVVVLNPYTDTAAGSPQHDWLLEDLAAVDQTVTPWVVAVAHCPLYSSNAAHRSEAQAERMKAAMEPVLVRNGVALLLTGHVHAYERSFPLDADGVPVSSSSNPEQLLSGALDGIGDGGGGDAGDDSDGGDDITGNRDAASAAGCRGRLQRR